MSAEYAFFILRSAEFSFTALTGAFLGLFYFLGLEYLRVDGWWRLLGALGLSALASVGVGVGNASAGEAFSVSVLGASSPSLYRVGGSEWLTADFADGRLGGQSWIKFGEGVEPPLVFDLRPGGVPWFSTHSLGGDALSLKDPTIWVGDVLDGYQQFSYGLESVRLATVAVPEPSSAVVGMGLVILLTSYSGYQLWKENQECRRIIRNLISRKGGSDGGVSGSDGSDAASGPRAAEDGRQRAGRRFDEQRSGVSN